MILPLENTLIQQFLSVWSHLTNHTSYKKSCHSRAETQRSLCDPIYDNTRKSELVLYKIRS
jgi:hypothetical protein